MPLLIEEMRAQWGQVNDWYHSQSLWYCPQNVCKLQSSYICGEITNQIKNNEAYTRFGDSIRQRLLAAFFGKVEHKGPRESRMQKLVLMFFIRCVWNCYAPYVVCVVCMRLSAIFQINRVVNPCFVCELLYLNCVLWVFVLNVAVYCTFLRCDLRRVSKFVRV